MSAAAIEWLESLGDDERGRYFAMCNMHRYQPEHHGLFSLRNTHTGTTGPGAKDGMCSGCRNVEELIIVE